MENKNDFVFQNLGDSELKTTPIILVDASGSVSFEYTKDPKLTVFTKIKTVVEKINAQKFRLIYWNSDNEREETNTFYRGIIKVPRELAKAAVGESFNTVSKYITMQCLTFPHLGFAAIPNEWISDKEPTHIYFITDGGIGYSECNHQELEKLKTKLKENIELLFNKHNNVHLHVIAVENKNYNFSDSESLNIMAGGDVFKVIRTNGLTKYITEFTSYVPNYNDGFRHIYKIIPPAGYIPYMDKCFSETVVDGFIGYIRNQIKEAVSDDELLKIVQNLSVTLKYLIKDKPKHIADGIIRLFCSMFANTKVDSAIVSYILDDTVRLEQEGKADIFSEYKTRLKNLYGETEKILMRSAKNGLNMSVGIMSMIIDNCIIVGDSSMITDNFVTKGVNYASACINVNNIVIPMLPIDSLFTDTNKQCIRQYIRGIISTQYGVERYGDIIIYVVLGLMLKVVCSNLDEKYKNYFRIFGTIMLQKKRTNTELNELERFETGVLPIPNTGKINDFYNFMRIVKNIIGLQTGISPMTLWYAMCLALNNEKLIVKQSIHCIDDIKKDLEIEPKDVLSKLSFDHAITIITLPKNLRFDYTCAITLENCDKIGGYKIEEHVTPSGFTCTPNFIISDAGYKSLFSQPRCICPVCYKHLKEESFTKIGPKEILNENIFSESFVNPFIVGIIKKPHHNNDNKEPDVVRFNVDNKTPDVKGPYGFPQQTCSVSWSSDSSKRTIILFKGTVGSGKTTYANRIQKAIEDLGGVCINESIDKYCRTGMTIQNGVENVKEEFKKIDSIENPFVVVIVDTCGERSDVSNIFDHNFNGWKKIIITPNFNPAKFDQYMKWTLRNVLKRPMHTPTSPYWLNPTSASLETCMNVHLKKAGMVFSRKIKKMSDSKDINKILVDIEADANEYEEYLNKEKNIDSEIADIINKITK